MTREQSIAQFGRDVAEPVMTAAECRAMLVRRYPERYGLAPVAPPPHPVEALDRAIGWTGVAEAQQQAKYAGIARAMGVGDE